MAGRMDQGEQPEWMTAARMLRDGRLVAVPTETVYGLAADAGNEAAVGRIFQVKDRPATNPLIVHVANVEAAKRCVSAWPDEAQALAERFWPGPLTIVLPKSSGIPDIVTAGGPTVALRVPDQPLTLEVLREFHRLGGIGLAAPSANRSEHISPTTAQHVRDDLGDRVDLILDGGPCQVGIESTVIRLGDAVPYVLRLGNVTVEILRDVLRCVEIAGDEAGVVQSPGRHARHYAPTSPTFFIEESDLQALQPPAVPFALVARANVALPPWADTVQSLSPEPAAFAASFYSTLRELEPSGQVIVLVLPPDSPEWSAIRDRMRRAGTRLM